MLIVGVSDLPVPAAAVIRSDAVSAWVSAEHLRPEGADATVPWTLIDAALTASGAGRDDVDVVAVAGRFNAPLSLRARPRLRRLLSSAFSPLRDVQAAWQSLLQSTGMGAYAADVAAEWLDDRFRERGFDHGRLLTVDVHRALAEAGYRMQPRDDVLVVAMQPMGDGVAFSVHRGHGAQLDRLFLQTDVASLHVHLSRVLSTLGLPEHDLHALEALGSAGTPDAELVLALGQELHADGHRLSRVTARRNTAMWARLGSLSRQDAAASVVDNLATTVTTLVRRHVREHGVGVVALVGEVFDAPRLVARIGELDGVTEVHALPRGGRDVLALGAAVSQAGLAPAARSLFLGPDVDDEACERALTMAGLTAQRKASLVGVLARGGAVVRFRERAGPGRLGMGRRCVMVRADDAYAIAALRDALGLADDVLPMCIHIATPNEGPVAYLPGLAGPLSQGTAAPRVSDVFRRRYAPVVGADGRAWIMRADPVLHPGLHAVIQAQLRATGCGAVAAFPLVDAEGTLVQTPEGVVRLFRRARLAAMQLGSFYVEQADT